MGIKICAMFSLIYEEKRNVVSEKCAKCIKFPLQKCDGRVIMKTVAFTRRAIFDGFDTKKGQWHDRA